MDDGIISSLKAELEQKEKELEQCRQRLRECEKEYIIAAKKAGTYTFRYDSVKCISVVDEKTAEIFHTGTVMEGIPYIQAQSGIIAEESRSEYIRIHEEIMNGRASSGGIVKLLPPNGEEMVFELSFEAVMDENGIPTGNAIGIYRRLSEAVNGMDVHDATVKAEIERQLEIIYALSREYYSIYYLDLDNNKILNVRYSDRYLSSVGAAGFVNQSGEIDKTRHRYAEKYVHPEDRARMEREHDRDNLIKCMEGGKTVSYVYRCLMDDHYEYTEWKFVPVKHSDSMCAVVGVRNVDDEVKNDLRKKAELEDALKRAESANIAKSIFLSGMSHDIRTPLNAVLGYASLAAADSDNTEKVKSCLERIEASGKHLLSLINDILDMSRIELGKMSISKRCCSISKICANAEGMIRPHTEEKRQHFLVDISENADVWVNSDDRKLERILINILGNAVKFTNEKGIICMKVKCHETDSLGRAMFSFIVKDNGIGMSEEFIRHIYEPFAQEDDCGTPGTGLGIPICRSFVEMMGGSMSITSKKGRGTEINVTLPLEICEKAETSENAPQPDENILKGKRVLVAEDNLINTELITELLSIQGAEAECVSDGAEAVKQLADSPDGYFDLVLMDIRMPVMNGYEAAERIRGLERKYCSEIPIIALSANAFSDDKEKAYRSGMNGYITKPVSMDEFIQITNKTIDKKCIKT